MRFMPADRGRRRRHLTPGGRGALWAANDELFYRRSSEEMPMVVAVATDPTLEVGTVRASCFRSLGAMRLLRRLVHLPSTRRRLLLATGTVVATVRILLWLLPYVKISRLIERTALLSAGEVPACSSKRRRAMSDDIAWAVPTAARYVPRAGLRRVGPIPDLLFTGVA